MTEKISRKLNDNVPKYLSCLQNQGNFKLFTDLIECGKSAKDGDADTKQEVWEGGSDPLFAFWVHPPQTVTPFSYVSFFIEK